MCVIFHEKLRQAEAKARQVPRGREDQGTASVAQIYVLTVYTTVCRLCLPVWLACVFSYIDMKTRRLCLLQKASHFYLSLTKFFVSAHS